MSFLNELVAELSLESKQGDSSKLEELLNYVIESGFNEMNRTLGFMESLETNFEKHFSNGDESFENYQSYTHTTSLIFQASGLDLPVSIAVPSFESEVVDKVAEEKKGNILQRAWQTLLNLLKKIRGFFSKTDTKAKIETVAEDAEAVKKRAADTEALILKRLDESMKEMITDEREKALRAKTRELDRKAKAVLDPNVPANQGIPNTISVSLINGLSEQYFERGLKDLTKKAFDGIRMMQLSRDHFDGWSVSKLQAFEKNLTPHFFKKNDSLKNKTIVTLKKPVAILNAISKWDMTEYNTSKNKLTNIHSDADGHLRHFSKEWEKIMTSDGINNNGKDAQGFVKEARVKLKLVHSLVNDIKDRIAYLDFLNKTMNQIVGAIESKVK